MMTFAAGERTGIFQLIGTQNPICFKLTRICKILYIHLGGSASKASCVLWDLTRFPAAARQKAGYQLFRVQEGIDPESWKPMSSVGPGVREIRIRESSGAFRVIFLATFSSAVYVLHCFEKKTQQTSTRDIDLARRRFKELLRELQS